MDEYASSLSPIAINRDTVAIYLDTTHELVVTSGSERRYPIGEAVREMTIAIDGDAIVLVVRNVIPGPNATVDGTSLGDALAALVRIEHDRVAVHPLQHYRSTDAAVAPDFIAAGKERLLLVNSSGSAVRCTYRGACSPVRPGGPGELDGALALPDGGMIVFDFDYSVSRIDADGHLVWTTKLSALSLIGATAEHVWVKSRPDDPLRRGLPIVALSLASGAKTATPAIARTQDRDELGRFLEISGVAATPVGTVVRGEFAGTLTVGNHRLETQVRGAVCWWRNPHDEDEYPIDLDGSCDGRHRKALITDHAAFVAVNPPLLRQRDD